MSYGLDDWAEEVIPRSADIDIFGTSHPGRVRPENQDQFLVASLHRVLQVHQTTLPEDHPALLRSASRGYIFLVADGVGGAPAGKEASELTLRAVAQYLTNVVDVCRQGVFDEEARFLGELTKAVAQSHEAIMQVGERDEDRRGMATTLTMVAVLWPRAYIVHVGDTRAYRLRDGVLELLTRDQTMAQVMIDAGALTADRAASSALNHMLTSAVGGRELLPAVQATDCRWSDMMLLCTDGLTKHLSDDDIKAIMLAHPTAEEIGHALVAAALERGGSDNITVVVGRLRPRE